MTDIILPRKGEILKVIQMYVGERPLLIGGPEQKTFGEILENILKEKNLMFERIDLSYEEFLIKAPDIKSPTDSPEPRYKVVGMGKCENIGDRFYSFYGRSEDYADLVPGINEQHLREIESNNPELQGKLIKTYD